ncbi:PLD nuclease N-terminal domain-containing protein [Streptomyces sp. NPDC006289]|uniref:PLD nuclease N-terminal domain-containing protein n=1 Tax=Streptomyces sp. NPDC006289 TaxID=3156744 RepID=UPI0033BA4513
MLRALIYILPLALTIYAFIDCLNTPEDEAKHLPKVAWVFIILLFWIVGPIVWLAAGKTRATSAGGGRPSEWHRGSRSRWVAPDDNPDFLRSLKDENKKDENKKDEPALRDKDESALKDWEADLRRREEEIRRRESGAGPEDQAPPATS